MRLSRTAVILTWLVCIACLIWPTGCAHPELCGLLLVDALIVPDLVSREANDYRPRSAFGVRELNLGDDGAVLHVRRVKTAWWGFERKCVDVGDLILNSALSAEPTLLARIAIEHGSACLPCFSRSCSRWRFFVTSFPQKGAGALSLGRWLGDSPGLCAFVVDEDAGRLRRLLGSAIHGWDRGFPHAFNAVDDCVAINGRGSCLSSRLAGSRWSVKRSKPAAKKPESSRVGHFGIYSMETGRLEYGLTVPGGAYACFQVPGQEPIWCGSRPYWSGSPAPLSLMQGNNVLAPEVLQLLAVTPDCSTVFFIMLVQSVDGLVPTLVSYNTGTGSFKNLLVWSGCPDNLIVCSGCAALRVRSDSQAFGVLNVQRRGDRMTVTGCTIMDLDGKPVENIRLPNPIAIAGTHSLIDVGPRAYDWNLDTKTIAYWDEATNMIIVREFGGSVVRDFTP